MALGITAVEGLNPWTFEIPAWPCTELRMFEELLFAVCSIVR